MIKYSHILWDWNGTLIDDVAATVECVNDTLTSYNLPKTSISEYLETIEPELDKYYGKFIDLSVHPITEILESFQQGYASRLNSLRLMPGAEKIIKQLYEDGVHQYIVSSFVEARLREHVAKFGLAQYFYEISGSGDILCGPKHTRAENLIKSVSKTECVFVGDSINDYMTAVSIGCDCILIAKGHQSKQDLENCKAGAPIKIYVLNDISEITSIIYKTE